MIKLSPKLQSYINQVEGETERPVRIKEVHKLGLTGMSAAFYPNPTHIYVEIKYASVENEHFEHSIAHEVTHGLLAYSRGYCQLEPKIGLTDLQRQSIGILATMVEDIVVNKIIFDAGFLAFPSAYLKETKRETKAINNRRQDYYHQYSQPFKSRFIVFRYIMAWGFLEFYDLNSSKTERILNNFIKACEMRYLEEVETANRIKEIIIANDIFTPKGYGDSIRLVLKLWDLDILIDFVVNA